MEILSRLFGSAARVKLLRLFLLNSDKPFDADTVALRSKVSLREVRKELHLLHEIGVIRQRGRPAERTWVLNPSFAFLSPLKSLLVSTVPFRNEEIIRRLKSIGRVRLMLIAGLFIESEDSRTDLLIVGNDIRRAILERAIRSMEAEMGREIVYSVLETEDFLYRVGVYDKFTRDIFDYPHQIILDKLGVALPVSR